MSTSTNTDMFSELPVEIVHRIWHQLPSKTDRENLRLVNHALVAKSFDAWAVEDRKKYKQPSLAIEIKYSPSDVLPLLSVSIGNFHDQGRFYEKVHQHGMEPEELCFIVRGLAKLKNFVIHLNYLHGRSGALERRYLDEMMSLLQDLRDIDRKHMDANLDCLQRPSFGFLGHQVDMLRAQPSATVHPATMEVLLDIVQPKALRLDQRSEYVLGHTVMRSRTYSAEFCRVLQNAHLNTLEILDRGQRIGEGRKAMRTADGIEHYKIHEESIWAEGSHAVELCLSNIMKTMGSEP